MTTFEVTALYKSGHLKFKPRATIHAEFVAKVEQVPEEIPEYLDGMQTTIYLTNGDRIPVAETYQDVVDKWHRALAASRT